MRSFCSTDRHNFRFTQWSRLFSLSSVFSSYLFFPSHDLHIIMITETRHSRTRLLYHEQRRPDPRRRRRRRHHTLDNATLDKFNFICVPLHRDEVTIRRSEVGFENACQNFFGRISLFHASSTKPILVVSSTLTNTVLRSTTYKLSFS